MNRKYFLAIFLPLICLGCGYQFGEGSLSSQYRTITVPYVDGDNTGELTAALVHEISRSGSFQYCKDSADLTLCVKIIDYIYENVAFRFDRDKKCKLTNSMIPTQTRLTALVEVSVIDSKQGCAALGPSRIYSSIDFDHDYYFSRDGINVDSLGQLTDYDSAYDAAQRPLHQAIAEKIVDFITHG